MGNIQEIVEQILVDSSLDLVKFQLKQSGKRSFLKILIDTSQGNITLGQVTHVSKMIKNNEDFNAKIDEDFRLEVSSPGLSYPLKKFNDFKRNINKTIKVKFIENETNQTLSGQLIQVEENDITISGKFGEKNIPLVDIDHGTIEIKFNR